MRNMWSIGFIFFLLLSHSVQAQVYKCENGMGEINFSDEPCAKGETGERLKWLKGAASNKKSKRSAYGVPAGAKKTAKKARKDNKAYVLLSLMTTTQLELETASLRSTLKGKTSDVAELLLPDGITVDLLKVDKIIITYKLGRGEVRARFVMADGYEEVKTIKKPFPVISGEAKIGRFSKSLQDIKQIEFFNSKKLLKTAGKKSLKNQSSAKKKPLAGKKPLANKEPSANKESPVIELDLSHQVPSADARKKKKITVASSAKKPAIKVVNKKSVNHSQLSTIQVDFVNEEKMFLQREALSSSKGNQKSRGQHFLVGDKEQIPYKAIKTIKVRPTTKNQLLVAVELKTKEIKMEVMSPPFTRIIGKTDSGAFDHSLLEIKSISFQR